MKYPPKSATPELTSVFKQPLILNPKYESLRPFVADIAKRFEQSDEVLHSGRNTIKVCREGGIALNVKRYGRPHWFNRIVYSFVRKPKGERAYRNGGRLLAAGFDSPPAGRDVCPASR